MSVYLSIVWLLKIVGSLWNQCSKFNYRASQTEDLRKQKNELHEGLKPNKCQKV